MPTSNDIPFQLVLDALLDIDNIFPPKYLHQFSDLEPDEVAGLEKIWLSVPAWRRQALMEDVGVLEQQDTLLSFETLGRMALRDPEAPVRLLAIQILGEFDSRDLALSYLQMLQTDADMEVRAAAATALGQFVYLGETEAISEKLNQQIVDGLLKVFNGEDEELVRRMAFESLGFSSREEIPGMIQAAYKSGNTEWTASALFAMGRSANEDWFPDVLASLENRMPAIRQEAARAAGELEIQEALPTLFEMLDDPDNETRLASIWSLSQIGGQGVREALEKLYRKTDSEEELAFLDEALDNLVYTEEIPLMPIMAFPELEDEEVPSELEEDDESLDWLLEEEFDEEEDEDEDELD
jgi:HEAT repeat protein